MPTVQKRGAGNLAAIFLTLLRYSFQRTDPKRTGAVVFWQILRLSGCSPVLGAQDVTSYTVIARDFQCRKTLENTGFFSDWPVIRYRLVMPDSC